MVLNERKRREIDPTTQMLNECIAEAEKNKTADAYTQEKLRELRDFFETTSAWYVQIRQWPTSTIVRFVKLGDKVLKVIGFGGKE